MSDWKDQAKRAYTERVAAERRAEAEKKRREREAERREIAEMDARVAAWREANPGIDVPDATQVKKVGLFDVELTRKITANLMGMADMGREALQLMDIPHNGARWYSYWSRINKAEGYYTEDVKCGVDFDLGDGLYLRIWGHPYYFHDVDWTRNLSLIRRMKKRIIELGDLHISSWEWKERDDGRWRDRLKVRLLEQMGRALAQRGDGEAEG